jgi:hypothetical protein
MLLCLDDKRALMSKVHAAQYLGSRWSFSSFLRF